IAVTSVRAEFGPDIAVECPHAPSPSVSKKQQSSTSMKTPRNHPKLAWTCIRAGAVVGAIAVLLCRTALGQTIPNPSFQTDTFTTSPGYISVNAPITGWTATPTDEVGLNPAGGSPF